MKFWRIGGWERSQQWHVRVDSDLGSRELRARAGCSSGKDAKSRIGGGAGRGPVREPHPSSLLLGGWTDGRAEAWCQQCQRQMTDQRGGGRLQVLPRQRPGPASWSPWCGSCPLTAAPMTTDGGYAASLTDADRQSEARRGVIRFRRFGIAAAPRLRHPLAVKTPRRTETLPSTIVHLVAVCPALPRVAGAAATASLLACRTTSFSNRLRCSSSNDNNNSPQNRTRRVACPFLRPDLCGSH